jgi:hypothetical protein
VRAAALTVLALLAACTTPGPLVCPAIPEPPPALLAVPPPLAPLPADLPLRPAGER